MLSKKLALAVVAGTALLAASGAYANHDHYRGHAPVRYGHADFGHRQFGHHYYRHAPRVVVRPAPVYYYTPEPAYYPPQPAYYAPPRPVIYGSIPLGDTRLRIGVQF